MKVLFLTLVNIDNINERNLYTDLMRKFRDEGHEVFIVTPSERKLKQKTTVNKLDAITLLKIKILNIQKTNLIEKGISTLLIEHQYLSGIKKYFPGVKFDLVLYSTPPITFTKVISYIKHRDGALSYLLLKDIFPQNAVDLGMLKKRGFIHRYFRHKEKQLYHISDFIGCMSPANVDYIIKNNPDINPKVVEVNPNSIEPDLTSISKEDIFSIRNRYNIPLESTTFIYGGNLGKPQGIDYLLDVLSSNKERHDIFFVVVGDGTEFSKVQNWFITNSPLNALLLSGLPKSEYDQMIQSCDVGLIFLDRKFTIPNFPSRLLSYLEYKMPVIAATDLTTDLGKIMEENKFGYWTESGDLLTMNNQISQLAQDDELIKEMGQRGYDYMQTNFMVSNSYERIINHFME
ncbi:MAG TPA: glycosyltransferase family 4 protein [Prolixibacteraceae bacterium]|jgi:glycosyltransferase involved in cell wall biosynthesis